MISPRFKLWLAALVVIVSGLSFISVTPAVAQWNCPPADNLANGYTAFVAMGTGLPNIVRSGAGLANPEIGQLPNGTFFTVRGGPQCVDGYNWWNIEGGGITGWTAEGTVDQPWILSWQCLGMMSRLAPGMQARVTPGLPNVVRAQAGAGANVGTIPAGGELQVIGNPVCVGGLTWWYVQYSTLIGWTAEGENGTYWLEAISFAPPPVPTVPPTNRPCTLPTRLQIGTSGIVTPGDPNVLRDLPGRNANGSRMIGQINGGTPVQILTGPQCVDGIMWWNVRAGSQIGWTAEGENNIYWLEPLTCVLVQGSVQGMVSRLAPGMLARVTPGLPNNLRSTANTSGRVLATIPAGSSMTILSTYSCDAQGRIWWQVSYGRLTGWTAEGENYVYWLMP